MKLSRLITVLAGIITITSADPAGYATGCSYITSFPELTNSTSKTLSIHQISEICQNPYFNYTEENAKKANHVDYYKVWLANMHSRDPKTLSDLGAFPAFVKDYAIRDFTCDVETGTCSPLPNLCEDIIITLTLRRPSSPILCLLEEARQVIMAIKTVQKITKFLSITFHLTSDLLSNTSTSTQSMIQDFQPEGTDGFKVEHECRFWNSLPPIFKKYEYKILNDFWFFSSITGYNKILDFRVFEEINGWQNHLSGILSRTVSRDGLEGWRREFMYGYERRKCGRQEWGADTDLVDPFSPLNFYTDDRTAQLRGDFQHLLNEIIVGIDVDGMNLVDWMGIGFWGPPDPVDKRIQENHQRNLVKRYEHAVIGSLLAYGKCYQKCRDLDMVQLRHNGWNGDPDLLQKEFADSRLYYVGDGGDASVCGVQCWTWKDAGNREERLRGFDQLSKYETTEEAIVKSSWKAYQKYHNYATDFLDMDPMLGAIESEGSYMYNTDESYMALPVCHSPSNMMMNWLPKVEEHPDRANESIRRSFMNHEVWPATAEGTWKSFPLSCGAWNSNETRRFDDLLGIEQGYDNGIVAFVKDQDWPQFRDMPWPLQHEKELTDGFVFITKNWTPVRRFLMLCEWGVRWPYKEEFGTQRKHWTKYIPGRNTRPTREVITNAGNDPRCFAVQEATKNMGEIEANNFFCNEVITKPKSQEFIFLQHEIHGGLDKNFGLKTHEDVCKEWVKLDLANHNFSRFQGIDDKPPVPAINFTQSLLVDVSRQIVASEDKALGHRPVLVP